MIRTIRACVLLSAVILACALAYTVPAGAAPLQQAATGTLTGQVLSADNVPLADVHLAAYNQDPTTPNRTPLSEFRSDAQGRFSVQVPPGTVWLQFQTQDINGQSFWGYSNKPVNIAAGQTITGQDFVVAIRVVSEPPTAVPAPAVQPTTVPLPETPPAPAVTPPGMPSTGA